ncbi:hypothetical protein Pdw03_5810 [Penicillium digitatum]|uniref:Uncharacterized protein n=1 Tax=Penicillium digitatum TaxID=36651 RepID=A0A7T6XVS0_PENDI|nr:hypothetical protein Pdw03_5810 [Penicillium digitatum]
MTSFPGYSSLYKSSRRTSPRHKDKYLRTFQIDFINSIYIHHVGLLPAAKPPEQEPLNQKPESTQPKSYGNEAFAGTANDNITPPKQHHLWGWPHHQEKQPGTKQQPSQKQEDVDWVVGT